MQEDGTKVYKQILDKCRSLNHSFWFAFRRRNKNQWPSWLQLALNMRHFCHLLQSKKHCATWQKLKLVANMRLLCHKWHSKKHNAARKKIKVGGKYVALVPEAAQQETPIRMAKVEPGSQHEALVPQAVPQGTGCGRTWVEVDSKYVTRVPQAAQQKTPMGVIEAEAGSNIWHLWYKRHSQKHFEARQKFDKMCLFEGVFDHWGFWSSPTAAAYIPHTAIYAVPGWKYWNHYPWK